MGLPLAVSPTTKGPGLYMTVDLLASAATPGTAPLKCVVMCPRSTAGNLTQDTEVRRAGSASDAATAFGASSPGHHMVMRIFEKFPTAIVDMIAPTASGGSTATIAITFAGTVGTAYNVHWVLCGRVLDVAWNASEVGSDIQTRAIAAINALGIPMSASAGAAGVVNLNFRVAGPWGNDATYAVTLQSGSGGTVNGGTTASGNLAGGTTEPTFATALATIANTKYDFYSLGVSNADAQSNSATSNPGRVKTQINNLNTGLNARLQQAVVGLTGSLSAAKTGAIGRNEPAMEYVECINGQSLPCEFAAAEVGDRMAKVSIDPAVNRIGAKLDNCFGSANIVADTPTAANIEDALANGVSIVSYDASGTPIVVRPITTHSQDSNGNPDTRVLDTSGVDGMYAVGNDIEIALPQEFAGAKITKNQQPGDEPLPAGVIEERDIFTFLVARLRFWQRRGVVRKDVLDAVIQAAISGTPSVYGTLIVQVDATDGSQVDIVIPAAIIKPLAKFGVILQKVA